MGVAENETLPSNLERILQERHPERRFQSVNLGVAGVNSAFVANRLEAQIIQYEPDAVVVWVGVNNHWNAAESDSWQAIGSAAPLRQLSLHSRVFRLATVAWVARNAPRYASLERGTRQAGAPRRFGEETIAAQPRRREPLSDEEVKRTLSFDLERMTRTARSHETSILFVLYPPPYGGVNAAIR